MPSLAKYRQKQIAVNGVRYTYPIPAETEGKLQEQVVSFVRAVYGVKTKANFFNGAKLRGTPSEIAAAVSKNKRAGGEKGENDLTICHVSPVHGFGALALELKLKPGTVFLKSGGFTKKPHEAEQAQYLEELNASGWLGTFAEGFDHAVQIIRWYMDGYGEPAIKTLLAEGRCEYTGNPIPVKVLRFDF